MTQKKPPCDVGVILNMPSSAVLVNGPSALLASGGVSRPTQQATPVVKRLTAVYRGYAVSVERK